MKLDKHALKYQPICLNIAFDDTNRIRKENNEYFSYEEVLEDGYCEGLYCKNCYDSYKLKYGKLADAKQRFGMAKRKLSALGKKLLVGVESEVLA
jgi:hypothetical protein